MCLYIFYVEKTKAIDLANKFAAAKYHVLIHSYSHCFLITRIETAE